jgi:hypothetical protein
MKNRVILIVILVIGFIVAGRAITTLRQPGDQNDEEIVIETGSEDYEDLNSEILELIAEIEAGGFNATQFDDSLSIELFELDPENEELGEIS